MANNDKDIPKAKRSVKFLKGDDKNSRPAPFKMTDGDGIGSFDNTFKLLFTKKYTPSASDIKKAGGNSQNPSQYTQESDIEFPRLSLDKKDVVTEFAGGGRIQIQHTTLVNNQWENDAVNAQVNYSKYHYKTTVKFSESPYSYVGYGNDFLFTNKLVAIKSKNIKGAQTDIITKKDVIIIDTPKPYKVGPLLIYSICGERHILPEEEAITTGGGDFGNLRLDELSSDEIFDAWKKLDDLQGGNAISYWNFYGNENDYSELTEYDEEFLANYNKASFGSFRFDSNTGKLSDLFKDIIEVAQNNNPLAVMSPSVVTIGVSKDDTKQGVLICNELEIPEEIISIRDEDDFSSRKAFYTRNKKLQGIIESSQSDEFLKNEFERLYEKALDKKLK